MNLKAKILVFAGPTASGKTSLSITLAQKFNGEVISADSFAQSPLEKIHSKSMLTAEYSGTNSTRG